VEVSDKLSVQITKGQWRNNNTENCYWESYMLMLLPEATAPALPLLTCDRCMPCIKESGRYMPKYFLKQTVLDTWNHTIEGYLRLGTFTQDPKDSVLYILNPDPAMCQAIGRRKKKRIRNNMDEAEAGPQGQICSKCNNPRHSYMKCTEASYFSTATSAPPSSSARGGHFSRYNEGMQ
jgi:hypothetical protein